MGAEETTRFTAKTTAKNYNAERQRRDLRRQWDDDISSSSGTDKLYGEIGDDTLASYAGSSLLDGGPGKDTISGGPDSDIYDYNFVSDSLPGAARDTITFEYPGSRIGDTINLVDIDANAMLAGNQPFQFKGTGPLTGPGQIHVVSGPLSDTVLQGEANGSAGFDFEILIKDGTYAPAAWVAEDFVL